MCNLTKRAMLIRLKVTKWSATKKDKKESANVAARHGAEARRVRVNKTLIESPALDRIKKIEGEARAYLYKHTLAWQDDGYRILPARKHMEVCTELRKFGAAFDQAVDGFIVDYNHARAEAQAALGSLFDPEDFATPEAVKDKFTFDSTVNPVPASGDFRVEMAEDDIKRIQAEIDERTRETEAQCKREVFERLHAVVARMAETLPRYNPDAKGKDKGNFTRTLTENIRDAVDILPGLNIGEDPELDHMIAQVRSRLAGYNTDTLKASETARKQATEAAQDIMQQMAGFMGGKPAQSATEAA